MATPMEELRALGYEYKFSPQRLVQVNDETKGFEFRDQGHYDKLADAVLRHVGTLLVSEAGLQPLAVPIGDDQSARPATRLRGTVDNGVARSQIFVSSGYEKAERLLLIVQGSGRVRVGVWGCALCINKDLDQGTMIPYLRVAKEKGYGVIVLNPNENVVDGRPVPGSESPEAHLSYVWEHLVENRCLPSASVCMVAHSNGGRALVSVLGTPLGERLLARLKKVALTDSYHDPRQVSALPDAARVFLANPDRVVNYVPSPAPIGTPTREWQSLGHVLSQEELGCCCLSACAPDHASTNHAALGAAFAFFDGAN